MEEAIDVDDVAGKLEKFSLNASPELRRNVDDRGRSSSQTQQHQDARQHGTELVQKCAAAKGLVDMSGEVLRLIVCLLEQRDVVCMGGTCHILRQTGRGFATGQQAFPLGPTVDERHGNGENAVEVDVKTGRLKKVARPGVGTILAKERVDKMTCYWEVQLKVFRGVRLWVGVATRGSVCRGGLNMQEFWAFDCFGCAWHENRMRGYGCKLKAGDVVGVLLNTANNCLSFFVQGQCMGTAFRNVRPPPGEGLYPLVVLPSLENETVELVRSPKAGGVLFPAPVRTLLVTKKTWKPRPHPNDWDIIVQTYDAQMIHRISGLDPAYTTVLQLKEALVKCHEMELFSPGQLALRIQGELLTDDSASLSAMGIAFGSRGAQLQDIYMYVPHLIS